MDRTTPIRLFRHTATVIRHADTVTRHAATVTRHARYSGESSLHKLTNKQWNDFWSRVSRGSTNECWLWTGQTRRQPNGMIYGRFSYTVDAITRRPHAHRLAYQYLHGDPADSLVCHSCDTTLCCNPAHLFTGSHADNMQDAAEKGRVARGEKHTRAKLTESQVREIRQSPAPYRTLADRYGVTPGAILNVKKRKTWAWLD
jgi:hypothetical protein